MCRTRNSRQIQLAPHRYNLDRVLAVVLDLILKESVMNIDGHEIGTAPAGQQLFIAVIVTKRPFLRHTAMSAIITRSCTRQYGFYVHHTALI
jgi:hypothetical protein